MRNYNHDAVTSCLGPGNGNDAVFIGDSTVREVFWAMARKLNPVAAEAESVKAEKHGDIQFHDGATTLSFIWDPFLRSNDLTRYLEASRGNADAPDRVALPMSKALVVIGGGLWFAKEGRNPVEEFKQAIDKLALPSKSSGRIGSTFQAGANRARFLPVQPPLYERLDAEHKDALNKKDIDAMNKYLKHLPAEYGIHALTAFLDMVDDEPAAYQENGLHVTKSVADQQAELILNMRCNEAYRSYPFSGTCCFEYPRPWNQIAFIIAGFALLFAMGWIELQSRLSFKLWPDLMLTGLEWVGTETQGPLGAVKNQLPLLRAILVLWAALFYCFLADRTQLFDKLHKLYNNQDWFLFCAGICLVGGLTIRRSASPQRPGLEKAIDVDQPFLSRDQTDEWKGWMQLLILAYHYTGASQVLWIYRIIRLLVASYLFMTGYGHAAYFYQKSDFSLKRVVAVNVRLNLLSVILPWMTNADYMFYYFAPLVTYWYAVVWITMRVGSSKNQNLSFFLTKIAIAATCTTFLHTQPGLLAPVFSVINTVFGSHWDAKEWMFRCALDQFIVYIGMIVAVLYIRSSKPPAPPPPPQESMATTSHTKAGASPELRRTLFFGASGASLFIYTVVSYSTTTKSSSNALHPFISPLAILAFIHLRNCTRGLRNNYSTAYAWIGRISLETFIMQYHLWLAADTKGLLSLGIFGDGGMGAGTSMLNAGMGLGRWADCVLLGVVFVWVSSKIAGATGVVTGALMKALF